MRRVALVTGAATGIGRETVKQLAEKGCCVVLTALTAAEADDAARALSAEHRLADDLVTGFGPLDVVRPEHARDAARFVRERWGRLDALVNNAAIIVEHEQPSVLAVEPALVAKTFANNTVGALTVSQAMLPLLRESAGTIVMVSSGMGAVGSTGSTFAGYRLSKAGLNGLTRLLHTALEGTGVRVNAVCPGHVKTPFGGPGATREVAEGASGVVWAAMLEPGGPSGGFFRDGAPIPW